MAVPPLVRTKLVWEREELMPAVADRPRETVPEKLLRLVRVIVDVPDAGLTRTV